MAQRRIVAPTSKPAAAASTTAAATTSPASNARSAADDALAASTAAASPTMAGRGTAISLARLFSSLDSATGDGRMDKVKTMLRADRFQLFSEVSDDRVTGVVKSQTDYSLFYACSIDKRGNYMCCTQNLNVCGGLRGKPCKHLLVLLVGLAQGTQLDPAIALNLVKATSGKKAVLDRDAMSATFIRYKGAEAGEVDWRPTETTPEDYYAF